MTPDQRARLTRRLQRMTRVPGAVDGASSAEVVLVVPPGASLERGFEHARRRLDDGVRVRLVGHGVTLERTWPGWVAGTPNLRLSELGAYAPSSRTTETSICVRETLRAWIASAFEGAFEDLRAEDVLLAWSLTRFSNPNYDPSTYTDGLLAEHGRDVELTDDRWVGAAMLRGGTGRGASDARLRRVGSRARFALKVAGGAALAWPLAAARMLREHVGARATYARLAAQRSVLGGREPEVWAALMPAWPRLSSHLANHIGAREARELGFLVFGTMRPVVRDEQNLRARRADPFASLPQLRDALARSPVEQISGPETIADVGRVLARSLRGTVRAVRGIVRYGPWVPDVGAGPIDLEAQVGQVVRLATVDVVEAFAGDAAARRLVRRRNVSGRPIVFATLVAPAQAAACWRLTAEGAIVVEYLHGFSTGGFSGAGPLKCFWTLPEVTDRAPNGERGIVAGTPPAEVATRRSERPRRVLFLTSYAHRDAAGGMDVPPWLVFQDEVLAASTSLRDDLELRWRPHPADLEHVVVDGTRRFPRLAVSRGGSLEDDLAWADVVVSSISTSVVQALVAGLPVFVHLLPEFEDTPLMSFVAPERSFRGTAELIEKLTAFLTTWDSRGSAPMDAERAALTTLYGPAARPADLFEALRDLASEMGERHRDAGGGRGGSPVVDPPA